MRALETLQERVVVCRRCPRLIAHCRAVASTKRRAWHEWDYWGRPVPSFGDPEAGLLIVGLAPGTHGANRTGRMFTGDRSGEFLFRALHATGFSTQATSISRDDGLGLRGAYITAAVRCAPPDNKPEPVEIRRCLPYLGEEIDLLHSVRVVVTLGRIAFDAYLSILLGRGLIARRAAFRFSHGAEYRLNDAGPVLIASYHPSQQNTSTGRLTGAMLRGIFARVRKHLAGRKG